MKNLSILGSTGSIGQSALSLVELYPEQFRVVALAAQQNEELLHQQCLKFRPQMATLFDSQAALRLKKRHSETTVLGGLEGLVEAACHPDAELVLSAISGAAGLVPTYRAVECGKNLALANKETLVAAGELLMPLVRRRNCLLVPVDSEHSALHQCLRGTTPDGEIRRLILTASGGPFLNLPSRAMSQVTVRQALNHPTWQMGRKITIDSATLMNKGLEVIEAHHLFQVGADQLSVVIHPQSIIHSLVEFVDGTMLAQMSVTDMRSALLYALTYPDRLSSRFPSLDLYSLPSLQLLAPDEKRFPCLRLAYASLREGGTCPAALNASNEVAVELFLKEQIPFSAIPVIIEEVLEQHSKERVSSLEQVLEIDRVTRIRAHELAGERIKRGE